MPFNHLRISPMLSAPLLGDYPSHTQVIEHLENIKTPFQKSLKLYTFYLNITKRGCKKHNWS